MRGFKPQRKGPPCRVCIRAETPWLRGPLGPYRIHSLFSLQETNGEDGIMGTYSRRVGFAVTLVGFGAAIAMAQSTNSPDSVDGRWDASLISNGAIIPFRLDISGSGQTVKG